MQLNGGCWLSFRTSRNKAVETALVVGEGPADAVWGTSDVVVLAAPDEDAGFHALVAEIERLNRLTEAAVERRGGGRGGLDNGLREQSIIGTRSG